MHSPRCKALIALALFLLVGASAYAQNSGSIRGTVVDDQGTPLAGAKVNAHAFDGRPKIGWVRFVETDQNGSFQIDGLEWGKYGVFAMKEDSEFPNLRVPLYSDNVFPTVVLSSASPVAQLLIKLGPKAGVIAGSVTNAANGAPLNSDFKLVRAASPDKWVETSAPASYRILLPSSTDVLVQVSAPGFTTWTSPAPLRLLPAQEMRLDISLEPSHDPNLRPSEFLVPEGFVGWLLLEYGVRGAPSAPIQNGLSVFKFPSEGALTTSSNGPERGAEDKYLYYFPDGSTREIPTDYRDGRGMIWGQFEGSRHGVMTQFGFFVGTEEQYKKFQNRQIHPGPVPTG